AAVHDEAPTIDETDWPQILGLYELLEKAAPNPMTTLNRAVAVAMVHGPRAGLELVASLESDSQLAGSHRLLATRAHLRELADDSDGAASDYLAAARRTASVPERRYLTSRALAAGARLGLTSWSYWPLRGIVGGAVMSEMTQEEALRLADALV